MRAVSRSARILDLVGLLLFGAGAATFVRAWIGFQGVPDFVPPPGAPDWAAIAYADRFLRLQWIGGGLMALGLAVVVAAWWVARRREAPAGAPGE